MHPTYSKENRQQLTRDCSKQVTAVLEHEINAHSIGFAWPNAEFIFISISNEIQEIREVLEQQQGKDRLIDEVRDFLMSAFCLCYYFNLNPEETLEHAHRKFARCFQKMRNIVAARNMDTMEKLSVQEKLLIWEYAKRTGAAGED